MRIGIAGRRGKNEVGIIGMKSDIVEKWGNKNRISQTWAVYGKHNRSITIEA